MLLSHLVGVEPSQPLGLISGLMVGSQSTLIIMVPIIIGSWAVGLISHPWNDSGGEWNVNIYRTQASARAGKDLGPLFQSILAKIPWKKQEPARD